MITDKLDNSSIYYELGDKIKVGFKFLEKNNLSEMECGIYEIDGRNIFVSIEEYYGKEIDSCLWELHKKYIDIQYIIRGKEKIGYINSDKIQILIDYNDEKDILFGKGDGEFLILNEGEFIIFNPTDGHMPSIKIDGNKIKKAVVKILV